MMVGIGILIAYPVGIWGTLMVMKRDVRARRMMKWPDRMDTVIRRTFFAA